MIINKYLNKLITCVAVLIALPFTTTYAVVITVGDIDNFSPGDAVDIPFQRAPLATATSWEANNQSLHGGTSLHFDQVTSNHTFGVTIDNLGAIDLAQVVDLEIRFKTVGASTDSIHFQLRDGDLPATNPGGGWFPPLSYGVALPTYFNQYGDGSNPFSGITTNVDLRSLLVGPNVAVIGGQSIAESINTLGHLDIFVQDDTAIDYVKLSYNTVPEPSTLAMFSLMVILAVVFRFRQKLA